MKNLKKRNLLIGLVTSDNLKDAKAFMSVLGIEDYIDFYATNDKYPYKPDTTSLEAFCKEFDLEKNQISMCGDSLKDMEYAKDLKSRIGVLCGSGTYDELKSKADVLLDNPCWLVEYLENNELI